MTALQCKRCASTHVLDYSDHGGGPGYACVECGYVSWAPIKRVAYILQRKCPAGWREVQRFATADAARQALASYRSHDTAEYRFIEETMTLNPPAPQSRWDGPRSDFDAQEAELQRLMAAERARAAQAYADEMARWMGGEP